MINKSNIHNWYPLHRHTLVYYKLANLPRLNSYVTFRLYMYYEIEVEIFQKLYRKDISTNIFSVHLNKRDVNGVKSKVTLFSY